MRVRGSGVCTLSERSARQYSKSWGGGRLGGAVDLGRERAAASGKGRVKPISMGPLADAIKDPSVSSRSPSFSRTASSEACDAVAFSSIAEAQARHRGVAASNALMKNCPVCSKICSMPAIQGSIDVGASHPPSFRASALGRPGFPWLCY